MKVVRNLVAVLIAGSFFLTAGCGNMNGSGEMIQIGTTKASLLGPPAEFRAVHPRLEDIYQMRVVFNSQPDGEAIAAQMEQGNIEFAFLSAKEYCSIEDPSPLRPVAQGINTLGKSSRKAFLVIRADSHLKNIQDCRGKRFAFGTYEDLLTDFAARAALEKAGVPETSLLQELATPPPLALFGRLYLGHDVARTIASDPLVNAGVIDELDYSRLSDTDGVFLLGAAKNQFIVVAETVEVPEILVVAGPSASDEQIEKMRNYLINGVKNDTHACTQLGLVGFTEPDIAGYDLVRPLVPRRS